MNKIQIITLIIGVGTVLGIGGVLTFLHNRNK